MTKRDVNFALFQLATATPAKVFVNPDQVRCFSADSTGTGTAIYFDSLHSIHVGEKLSDVEKKLSGK